MTSIRQRDAGNCVSVAVIQAAISVFGINEVFESKEDNNGIFFIRLKNGDSFTISKEELEIAEATAKIGYDKTFKYVYDYVILCYAVIIKQRIKIDKYSDFKTSSEKVAGGGWTPTSFYYLGLENYAECKGRFASVDGLTGVVAWRGHHAVYVNNHKYFSQKVRNLNLFFTGRYVLHNNEMYEIHKDEVHKIHISRFPYNDFLFEYFEEES
jgi:hypothetical protein